LLPAPSTRQRPSTDSPFEEQNMSQTLPNNLLHNPFHNRFNDAVTQRRDEMQSYENTIWLRQRIQAPHTNFNAAPSTIAIKQTTGSSTTSQLTSFERICARILALLLA
jgi:hypothetical protein